MSKENEHNSVSTKDLKEKISEKNPELLKGLSDKKVDEILKIIREQYSVSVTQEVTNIRSGPLPSPEELKGFHDINPEFAETIVKMAKKEQEYSHNRDEKIINKSFEVKARGQWLALIVAAIAIGGGVTCILYGYVISGTIIGGVGLTGLIAEFLEKSFFDKSKTKEE